MTSSLPPRVGCAVSVGTASGGHNRKFLHNQDLFYYEQVLIHLFYVRINACIKEANGVGPFSTNTS